MTFFGRSTLVNFILMMVLVEVVVSAPTLKSADAARTDSGDRGHQTTVDTPSPQLTQQSPPVYWDIEDFDDATDPIPQAFIATFGPEAYFVAPSNTIFEEDLLVPGTTPEQAARLIYAPGDVTIKPGSSSLSSLYGHLYPPSGQVPVYVTIVTPGTIKMAADVQNIKFIHPGEHPTFSNGGPVDYLLFMSTNGTQLSTCSSGTAEKGIDWSASNSAWQGIIYVPNGVVTMSMSGNDSQGIGAMIAWCIYLSGSHIDLIGDPDMLPTIGIAE